jgi:hypothetical protein
LRIVSDFDGFSFQPVDVGHNAVSDSNGAFAFLDVPAGDYTLAGIRRVQQSDLILPDPDGLWVREAITLRAGESPHLNLRMQPGVTVSGTIAVDGSPPETGQLVGVSLRTPRRRGSTGASPRQSAPPPGQFLITGVYPGTYRILAGGGRTLVTPEAILLDGRDVSDLPVAIDRSSLRDIRVSLTRRVAALRGSLTDSLGKPAIGDWVIVFPVDPAYWPHVEDDSYRTKRFPVASDGIFATSGLAAGEYFIAGVSDQAMDAWPDDRLFENLSRNATRLTLVAGPNPDIRLTIIR